MSVVDVEQRWPRNGRLIGHVANETITRKLLHSYRHVRWSKILPLWSHLSYSLDCTLDLLKQIEGWFLKLVEALKSPAWYPWENVFCSIMPEKQAQCFAFTIKAYPNTSRAAVKKYIQTVHAVFFLIVCELSQSHKGNERGQNCENRLLKHLL